MLSLFVSLSGCGTKGVTTSHELVVLPAKPKEAKVLFEQCYQYYEHCKTQATPKGYGPFPCRAPRACLDEKNFAKLFQNKIKLKAYVQKLENLLKPFTVQE